MSRPQKLKPGRKPPGKTVPSRPFPGASPRLRRLFWAATLLTPVVFFLLLELTLRLVQYGPNTDLFQTWDWKGKKYYRMNPDVVARYFSRKGFTTYVSRDVFPAEKPANAYRIFCLGASSTIGFPYMFNASFSSLLHDRLTRLHPEMQIEMVNVGITAVNSYTVADLTHDLMEYSPDLLIVYMAHNEFYGALGVGSTESGSASRFAVRAYLALRKLKTVQFIRSILAGLASGEGSGYERGKTLMEQVVRDRSISYRSPEYQTALEEFRNNLSDILQTARDHQVGILLSTVTSNLRSQPPFVPVFSDAAPPSVRDQWAASYRQAAARDSAGDPVGAADAFRALVQLDSMRADGRFGLARALDRLSRPAEAFREYAAARDLDALRFRASTDFNSVIREVAREWKAPLVEMENTFAEHSPGGIPDSTLFWEHVHPRLAGYFLMAKEFCRAMAASGAVRPQREWRWDLDLPDSAYMQLSGVTPFDEEVARLRIGVLMSRWPFRDPPAEFTYEPSDLLQTTAWDYAQGKIGWGSAHARLAESYFRAKDFARAEQEYLAIAKNSVYDPEYFDKVGDLQAAQGKFREALETFKTSMRISDTQFIRARLGSVALHLADPAAAVMHLEAALNMDQTAAEKFPLPQRVRAMALLGRAYLLQGRKDDARQQLERLIAVAPNAPDVQMLRSALAGEPPKHR